MKETEKIRIAIAGGGTGGHLFPALNLGRAMEEQWNARLLFFGAERGIEKGILPRKGYDVIFLPVQGFKRNLSAKNLAFPFKVWRSVAKAKKALKEFNPHLVLGTGGYVMGPVLWAAKQLGIPYVIQEQNSFPGLTTRLLEPHAQAVFAAYEEVKDHLSGKTPVFVTGNPIRLPKGEIDREAAIRQFGFSPKHLTVFILGGSQGAENINRAVFALFSKKGWHEEFQWIWQTGDAHFKKWSRKIAAVEERPLLKLIPFISNMMTAYQAADLVVCRGGAMTLSELMVTGRAAVIVPNPYSTANHQYKNALVLAGKGAAEVIKDDEEMPRKLAETLQRLLQSPEKIKEMSRNMAALNPGDSVQKILEIIKNILHEKGMKVGNEQ